MNLPTDESTSLNNEAASTAASNGQKPDAAKADSSTAQKGIDKATSLDDVAKAFTADLPTEAELEAEANEQAASDQQQQAEKDDQAVEGDDTADEAAEASENDEQDEKKDGEDESLTDATKPPPFHEHPRWQQLVAERDQFKPLAEQQTALVQYMQANRISGDDLRGMLEIGALMQSNPAEALKRLKPIYEGLGQLTGESLPADLEAQVASGKITPDVAAKLAKAQAEGRLLQMQREQDQVAQRQSNQQQLVSALSEWAGTKQRTDLGFKSGTPLWQMVDDRLQVMSLRTPPRTAQEAVRMAEQAYLDVKKVLTPTARTATATTKPAAGTKRSLSSNGSSAVKTKEPTNLDEAAMQATGLRWQVPKKGF